MEGSEKPPVGEASSQAPGQKKAVCEFKGDGSGDVKGKIYIAQESGAITATYKVELSGLAPGKHGLHVHQNGDLGDNCAAAGGHFNPHNATYSGHDNMSIPIGDLQNVVAEYAGKVVATLEDVKATIGGEIDVTGKAMVIHEDADDGHGHAGARVGCCLIVAEGK